MRVSGKFPGWSPVGAWLLLIAVLASVGSAAAAVPAADEAPRVFRVHYDTPDDIAMLQEFDLWEFHDRQAGYVLVAVTGDDERARLSALGLRLVLDEERTAEIAAAIPQAGQRAGIPGYPCYRTVEETYATAQQIVTDHPDLATWTAVGETWERQSGSGGYELMVLRLTQTSVPGPKPKLFITSSIHAREYTPAELTTRFAEYLVGGYGLDADATWLLDYHEIHLMLQANPDGRKFAEGGASWRKNTNQDYCSPTSASRGADLNRNFEFGWGCCGGSSGSECSNTYRGASAASEPEVRAIQDYLLAEFPDQRGPELGDPAPADATGVYLDIHSFSELVLWPWGFVGSAPNQAALQTFGRKLAWFNGYTPQQALQLYVTDGTTMDFGYGELGVASLVYELGTSFFQNCSSFENTILPDNLASLIYAAKAARAPYLTPAGPDVTNVQVAPAAVAPGTLVQLVATVDDTRYNDENGAETTQVVRYAEYTIDTPPWDSAAEARRMNISDGGFGAPIEDFAVEVDTTGLADGRHTIFVRGRDVSGNWGAVSAVFLDVLDPVGDADEDGTANDSDCAVFDPALWSAPGPATGLSIARDTPDRWSWAGPADPGAGTVVFDVLRSADPGDFDAAACVDSGMSDPTTVDTSLPAAGAMAAYLVRVRNECGESLGEGSDAGPRTGASCP